MIKLYFSVLLFLKRGILTTPLITIIVFSIILTDINYAHSTSRVADETVSTEQEKKSLEALKKKLDSIYKSVETSRLNADHVPGIITVYYGKDLVRRGIKTVGEAMTLVPGVNFAFNSGNNWKTVIRGLPQTFSTGHIKILLNGNPLITITGIELLPNIPIEIVDRIEMIRGPASTIYGEYAFSGVLNVITYSNNNSVYAGAGSYDTYSSEINFSKVTFNNALSLNLNLGYKSTKRGYLNTNSYRTYSPEDTNTSPEDINNSPVDINNSDEFQGADQPGYITSINSQSDINYPVKKLITVIGDVGYKATRLAGYHIENAQGSYYSIFQEGIFLSQDYSVSDKILLKLKTGFQKQNSDENYDGFYLSSPHTVNQIYKIKYNAEKYQSGIDVLWKSSEKNKIKSGLLYTLSKPVQLWRDTTQGEQTIELKERELISLFFQDSYFIREKYNLTFGIRYDNYDNFESFFSPRLSIVYHLNRQKNNLSQHILKAQFARAFKPPAFFDLVDPGAPALTISDYTGFETNDTFEISYIFKKSNSVARLTGYYALLSIRPENILISNPSNEKKSLYGAEFEFEHDLLSDILSIKTNCSYATAKDKKTDKELPDSINWLTNTELKWNPVSAFNLSLNYRFTGKTKEDLSSSDSKQVNSLDLTGFLQPWGGNWSIYLGIKNILNEDVRYPSHLDQDHIPGNLLVSFPAACQRPESWWWLKVAYAF